MSDISNFFNNQTSKTLYSLAKTIPDRRKLQGKVWENFCNTKEEKLKTPARFKAHPEHVLSESDSSTDSSALIYHVKSPNCNIDLMQSGGSTESIDTPKSVISCPKDTSNPVHRSVNDYVTDTDTDIDKKTSSEVVLTKKTTKSIRRIDKETKSKLYNTQSKENSAVSLQKTMKTKQVAKDNIQNSTSMLAEKSFAKKLPKDNNVDQKLRILQQKILGSLEEVRMVMDVGVVPPDGAEDLERRKKRATEFSSRFSRNYLYQLGRQINELQRLTNRSGCCTYRSNGTIHQRLLNSHQIILQGLQAYHKYLPNSIANASVDKLKDLLNQAISLNKLHEIFLNLDQTGSTKREALVQTMDTRCKLLLDKIQENYDLVSTVSLIRSTSTKLSLLGYNVCRKPKNQQFQRKIPVESRLSMYSVTAGFRQSNSWKKAVANVAKQQLKYNNVPSRYRTATLKHRPPASKLSNPDIPLKERLYPKPTCDTPHYDTLNEDCIQTLVEMEKDKGLDIKDSEETVTKHLLNGVTDLQDTPSVENMKIEVLRPLLETLFYQISKNGKAMTQEQFGNLQKGLLGMVQDVDKSKNRETGSNNNGVTSNMQNIQRMTQSFLEECLGQPVETNSCTDFVEKLAMLAKQSDDKIGAERKGDGDKKRGNKSKRKQTVSVSGVRNAQLICIKDDDSIIENSDNQKSNSQNFKVPNGLNPAGIKLKKETTSSETQTNALSETTKSNDNAFVKNRSESVTSVKISRLVNKPLRPLILLPKPEAVNIIQYKLKFHKFTKGNHMYKKSSKTLPWVILEKISDKLLDYLLLAVAREIEVNEILESMYESEFQ